MRLLRFYYRDRPIYTPPIVSQISVRMFFLKPYIIGEVCIKLTACIFYSRVFISRKKCVKTENLYLLRWKSWIFSLKSVEVRGARSVLHSECCFIGLFSLFWKKKKWFIRSACCLCICVYPSPLTNFEMSELIFMKLGMYIMTTKPIWTA
jgi:hypothetical protein